MQETIDNTSAVAIRRPPGSVVVFDNQAASDVFLSYNKDQLNQSSGPAGILLKAASTTDPRCRLQIYPFPGLIWARTAAATPIQIIVEAEGRNQ